MRMLLSDVINIFTVELDGLQCKSYIKILLAFTVFKFRAHVSIRAPIHV